MEIKEYSIIARMEATRIPMNPGLKKLKRTMKDYTNSRKSTV